MSQRNPMNDRYQTDEHRGQTRKSAATMKPKTKAASSVRIQPTVKTKQQKKAYVCIIGALYVDFSKIRKVRRAYQEEMMSKKTKEMRAAEKQQKAAQRAAKQKVEEAPAVEEAPKKRGLFGNGFRLPKKQEAEPMEAKTSDKDSTK